MNLYPQKYFSITEIKRFVVIFYFIGLVGMLIPITQKIFMYLIPFAIILNLYLLGAFHSSYNKKSIIIFITVFILNFFVEVFGVNTGNIFGVYHYGDSLGIKVYNTPIIIGFNWLYVIYSADSIISDLNKKFSSRIINIVMASLLPVFYDIILEIVAPKIGMWYWEGKSVPLRNYFSWFIISFVLITIFELSDIKTKNPIAKLIFLSQFIFFVLLSIFLK